MKEIATLGGGCFWCLEAIYKIVNGVTAVTSGYAGGDVKNPSYQQVCMGSTGHAEVVQIEFDPAQITYKEILEIFFLTHDPTTLNRQGADTGTQYRSAIFTHSSAQTELAKSYIAELEKHNHFNNPIVTTIEELDVFYPAEEYHQDYFEKNPYQGYCRIVITPKLNKFKKIYSK